mgnify:CR=1 FL=1
MIAASIDIGSNTVRLLIAAVVNGRICSVLYQQRAITRLAEGLEYTNKLSEDAILRTLSVLKQFVKKTKEYDAVKVIAVSTSAVREAENSNYFLAGAKNIGLNIDVIDGTSESYLTFLGVKSGINIEGKKTLIFDIGGGSTEFVFYNGRRVAFSCSLNLGAVKLSEKFEMADVVNQTTKNMLISDINKTLSQIIWREIKPEMLVGTAGTVTTLAAIDLQMEQYNPEIINGHVLQRERIDDMLLNLMLVNAESRSAKKGLEKGREDLIIPGGLIVLQIMKFAESDSLVVSDNGLREGILIQAADAGN